MGNKRKSAIYACDFETTVEKNTHEQTETWVWSAAYAKLYSEEQNIFRNIGDFMWWMFSTPDKSIFYFHNLKFDGFFILWWLLNNGFTFQHVKKYHALENQTFDCVISGDNRFYTMTIKHNGFFFFIRDSLKLLPFRLDQIGKAFNTEHKKLKMDYKAEHHKPDGFITADEAAYILNDVLCLKEALEIMLDRGMKKLTIGANCMKFYKDWFRKVGKFENVFPNLKEVRLLPEQYGYDDCDSYIRKSYRGGWCYLKPEYENRWIRTPGKTFDVNSLYPSVMHSDSGFYYPVGQPHFFKKEIPLEAWNDDKIFFVRLRFIGRLKEKHLPTIQVKDNLLYRPTKWLESTDIYYNGKYHKYYFDTSGILRRAELTLTLTKPDLILLRQHYDIEKLEVLDGCFFDGKQGLFDTYINYWMKVKTESKDKVNRTIAKLMLNNLYGKFATNDDSSYMAPFLDDSGIVGLDPVQEHQKPTINIAVGTMVTAYARYFTITHAQKNYDSFIYADTDSLHVLDHGGAFVDIVEDDKALLTWKNESSWTSAKFIRQKTYIEFIRKEDSEPVKPYWNIKCAGMPESCKRRFLDTHPITDFDYFESEVVQIQKNGRLFDILSEKGVCVSGKLQPKRIRGGVVLVENLYTLSEHKELNLKKWLQGNTKNDTI